MLRGCGRAGVLQTLLCYTHTFILQENPNPQPYVQKVPLPTEDSFRRIHQPPFPYLDWMHIQEIIDEGLAKHNIKNK